MINTSEDRLVAALKQKGERIRVDVDSAPVLVGAQRRRVRRRTTQQIVSVLTVVAVLGVGVGVRDRLFREKPVDVAVTANNRFRLIPTWLPEGTNLELLNDGPARSFAGHMSSWREGDRSVEVVVSPASTHDGETLETQLQWLQASTPQADQVPVRSMSWRSDANTVSLTVFGPTTPEQFALLARSVRVLGQPPVATLQPDPLEMPLVYAGPVRDYNSRSEWFLNGWGEEPVTILAEQLSETRLRIENSIVRSNAATAERSVRIRGVKGTLVVSNDPSGEASASLLWSEQGWRITISAASEEVVMRVAEGLQEATDSEWEEIPRTRPADTAADPQVGTESTAGHDGG